VGSQFNDLIINESEKYQEKNETTADDIAVLQYTSGTTRKFPEAVKHYHKSVVVTVPLAVFVLGLRKEDRYFTPFHPSWGGGMWYGTIAPLALGVTIGAYSDKFDPKIFLDALREFKINNLSAPPTVYRMVKNSGLLDQYDLKLDKLSYSMEPMDTDTFEYFKKKFCVSLCSYY
ncbi:MAG: AMP-binding protein, partial [Syntrophales bacterium]|nr:AMP-binding protein [Syntrophales bacterium]